MGNRRSDLTKTAGLTFPKPQVTQPPESEPVANAHAPAHTRARFKPEVNQSNPESAGVISHPASGQPPPSPALKAAVAVLAEAPAQKPPVKKPSAKEKRAAALASADAEAARLFALWQELSGNTTAKGPAGVDLITQRIAKHGVEDVEYAIRCACASPWWRGELPDSPKAPPRMRVLDSLLRHEKITAHSAEWRE